MKIPLFLFLLAFSIAGIAQDEPVQIAEIPAHVPTCADAENVMICNGAWVQQFVVRNVKVSGKTIRKTGGGTVLIRYVIDKDGKVEEVTVEQSLDPKLDAACVKAVQKLPQHIPATMDGVPVRMLFHIPVKFTIK